jgi:hypothetical protein
VRGKDYCVRFQCLCSCFAIDGQKSGMQSAPVVFAAAVCVRAWACIFTLKEVDDSGARLGESPYLEV